MSVNNNVTYTHPNIYIVLYIVLTMYNDVPLFGTDNIVYSMYNSIIVVLRLLRSSRTYPLNARDC